MSDLIELTQLDANRNKLLLNTVTDQFSVVGYYYNNHGDYKRHVNGRTLLTMHQARRAPCMVNKVRQ